MSDERESVQLETPEDPFKGSDPWFDFDLHGPDSVGNDPLAKWAGARDKCPVGWSKNYDGHWMVTGYPEATAVMHDPETFSSDEMMIPPIPGKQGPFIPLELDPPEHFKYRTLLSGPFSPGRSARMTDDIHQMTDWLIDQFIERGEADLAKELAMELPAMLCCYLFGQPCEEYPDIRDWTNIIVHKVASAPEETLEPTVNIYTYYLGALEARKENPGENDILSILLSAEVDGEKLTEEEILDFCLILDIAAVDTTQKVLGGMLWYLGEHPELRKQLRENPDLHNKAAEEFIRYFAPTIPCRRVTKDTEFFGRQLKKDDGLVLCLPLAQRDPRQFNEPETLDVDREDNRHTAFGLGLHRCLGIHIARIEVKGVLEKVLNRIVDWDIVGDVAYSTGQVWGKTTVPAQFSPGERLGVALPPPLR